MKAIRTEYLPSEHRPIRIRARDCDHNQVVISRDQYETETDAHIAAARELCALMHWDGTLASGGFGDGIMFHVFIETADDEREMICVQTQQLQPSQTV